MIYAAASISASVSAMTSSNADCLLNRRDLHQLPTADRTVAVLQRDNQIPPLFLELNQWQAVIG